MKRLLVFLMAMGVSMFGFGKSKSVIEVRFIEGKNESPFAVAEVPVDKLPETFEIDTVMHLGEDDWRVIGAEPSQKSEFSKSGNLSLYLVKNEIVQVDPNELLYSLPTINNELASVENAKSLENIAVFREDDWRQFEFIDKRYEALINEEFNHINRIYQTQKVGSGFKNLHLREKIATPLKGSQLTVSDLTGYFKAAHLYKGVAFNNAAATLVDGFAFKTESDWIFWGTKSDTGVITTLNISPTKESKIATIAHDIDKFTKARDLYLVHWPRLFWCGPDRHKFSVYGE